jgi:N-acetyl-anhydromuramyl-L-alanine amidase AmpD
MNSPQPSPKALLSNPEALVTGSGLAITRIVLHCTATRAGQAIDAATIRKWHKANGWSDIGYHFVIALDGSVERGRAEHVPGAHVAGFNTGSIGVVYVGGLDAQGKPKDTRTPEQLEAMRRLVSALSRAYPKAKVMGHRDLSPDRDRDGVVEPHEWLKACPCFDARAWWAKVRA